MRDLAGVRLAAGGYNLIYIYIYIYIAELIEPPAVLLHCIRGDCDRASLQLGDSRLVDVETGTGRCLPDSTARGRPTGQADDGDGGG